MKDLTDITLILDNSSSMQPIAEGTRTAVNQFIVEQQKIPGAACFTLIKFSDPQHIRPIAPPSPMPHIFPDDPQDPRAVICCHVPLEAYDPLQPGSYSPMGNTALHDAMGYTIDQLGLRLEATPESDRPNKVIVVTMTDGHENWSKVYTADRIAKMVAHQRDTYNWQFLYLGANQNAFKVGAQIAIVQDACYNFSASNEGMLKAMYANNAAVGRYRMGKSLTASYSAEDRK